jgi:hypothetical protein
MATTKKTTKKKTVFDFKSIKTVEDAFKKNGYDSAKLPDLSMIPEKFRTQLTNCFLLMVIFEAINDGWEPDFSKETRHTTRMKDQLEMSFGKFDNDPFIMSITFGNGDMLKITKY